MLRTPDLQDSIESLYSVLENYSLRESTDACPCCHSPEEERRLRATLLRKLSKSDLYTYATDALYTWGDEEDFKHFLPRICELLVESNGDDFVDPQAVFAKLVYQSHWRSWPKQETDSIEKYFRSAWDAVLNSDPDDLGFDGAEDWLESIAQAEQDLSPYLEFWLACPSENAHRNLARAILFFPFTKSPGGYWGDRKEQFQQVAEWLRRPAVRQKLADAVEKWSNATFGAELFDAAALL